MQYIMRDRLFLISGILGLGALAMTLMLAFIGPRQTGPLPPGFITPVMAFEFAESQKEVYHLFEPGGAAEAMDRVNRWDFLYMTFYSLFLGTFALAAGRRTGRAIFYIAAVVALIVLYADALENVQLLGLTMKMRMDGGSLRAALERLHVYTWLKWGGLALWFLLMRYYFQRAGRFGRFVGWVSVFPLLLGIAAFVRPGLMSELFALSIGLLFLLLTVYSWRSRRPQPSLVDNQLAIGDL